MWYNDPYISSKGTRKVARNTEVALDKNNKQVIFKNFTQFAVYINEINNIQVDHVKSPDVVIPISHLLEHFDNYTKTPNSSWQYFRDEPNKILTDSLKHLNLNQNLQIILTMDVKLITK